MQIFNISLQKYLPTTIMERHFCAIGQNRMLLQRTRDATRRDEIRFKIRSRSIQRFELQEKQRN